MPKDPNFRAAAACGVAGPVAWTVACAVFLFRTDPSQLGSYKALLAALGRPSVAFMLFGILGLLGGLIGGGKGRALSSLAAGLVVGGLSILVVRTENPVLATTFPMVAGPIMGIGYSLGARSGRKISKGGFSGLFAGFTTSILCFLLFGLGRSVFFDTAMGIYLGGLAVSYAATFVFFVFYSTPGRTPAPAPAPTRRTNGSR